MDKYIGKVLDNRYEILEVIGVGGMSVVYKAHCNRLNRYVAIKILKDELFAEENLRRQFHDESQSVAILSHPNIVSVYDVSHYEGTEYIVMELIDGITLKDFLDRRGALPWKEVTFFALQIAKALDHAHSRGIIHRDIKPQNMMLLRDGTLKVTDFGIAKNTVQQGTKNIGEAIGSVHYVSPEQAKGSIVDARSDIYSFGVVMYEMLTGRLPFEGDSPISVAIQHINSMALPPSDFVEGIPAALEGITMKAMNPSLSKRYASAKDVLRDLEGFRSDPYFTLPVEDLPLKSESNVNTAEIQTSPISADTNAEPSDAAKKDNKSVSNSSSKGTHAASRKQKNKALFNLDFLRKSVSKREGDQVKNSSQSPNSKKSSREYDMAGFSGAVIFALVAILLFLGGAIIFVINVINPFGSPGNTKLTVPNLIGLYYEDVINSGEYFEYTIEAGEYLYSDVYDNGQIMDQTPDAKRSISANGVITVVVSRGPKAFKLPDYSGKEHQDVEIELRQKNINTVLKGETSETLAFGKVISTMPAAGNTVSQNETVTIVYSLGKEAEQTRVPDLLNLTEHQALQKLSEAGLFAAVPVYMQDQAPAGKVIYQTIPADSIVSRGTLITFHVSTGPNGGTTPPDSEIGSGTSYDPYPNDSKKRTMYFDVIFYDSSADKIEVTVKVNEYVEYEGTHYYAEGHVVVPLTGYAGGFSTITVIQNGKIVVSENIKFE